MDHRVGVALTLKRDLDIVDGTGRVGEQNQFEIDFDDLGAGEPRQGQQAGEDQSAQHGITSIDTMDR